MPSDALRETTIETARTAAGVIMSGAVRRPVGSRRAYKDAAALEHLAGFKRWLTTDHPGRMADLVPVFVVTLRSRLIALEAKTLDAAND